ncbi:MAG: VWA domain-containing protein [Deltaproteobacteria bacterium]|nr:VWA domain-containing protein [Deltaproteobacteria bacterium]
MDLDSGLVGPGGPVVLRGVAVDVAVRGVAMRASVAQRYRNEEAVAIEAVYSFPLPEAAAVCGFEADVGGRRVVGRVEDRRKGAAEYDEAIDRGARAFRMDEERPNVFVACVGNLGPGEEATLRLSYVCDLPQVGDCLQVRVPATIAPRYVPARVAAEMTGDERDAIAPPVAAAIPYGLSLAVDVEAASEVKEVACPSHPAVVSIAGRRASVRLVSDEVRMDRDFVADVRLRDPRAPAAMIAPGPDGERVVLLTGVPQWALRREPIDAVFVIDRSGSMQGDGIRSARDALLLALRSLVAGDRFEVVGFGSTVECMFGRPVPYRQESLDEATARVRAMDADLGGTEVLPALAAAMEGRRDGRRREVLLLTDGEVGNESECIAYAARHAKRARLFTIGIGHAASEFLVRGLARASGGTAEFLHPSERMESRVLGQLGRMAAPRVRDVRLDWGGLEVDLVAPAAPTLHRGERFAVYARVRGGEAREVAIIGTGPDGEVRVAAPLAPCETGDDPILPALMARKAIRDIEEAAGGARRSGRRTGRDRLIELSRRYSVLCSATTYLAVDETAEAAPTARGRPARRRIPIALAHGWHGWDTAWVDTATRGFSLRRRTASLRLAGVPLASSLSYCCMAPDAPDVPDAAPVREADGHAPEDPLVRLCSLQRADGSWDLTPEVTELVAGEEADFQVPRADPPLRPDVADRVLATAMAIRVLARCFADRADAWHMIADKAVAWLASVGMLDAVGGDPRAARAVGT